MSKNEDIGAIIQAQLKYQDGGMMYYDYKTIQDGEQVWISGVIINESEKVFVSDTQREARAKAERYMEETLTRMSVLTQFLITTESTEEKATLVELSHDKNLDTTDEPSINTDMLN